MSPKVAIIMSVYKSDSLDYLKESVKSMLEQTYSNIKFYLYCDGPVPADISDYLLSLELSCKSVVLKSSKKNEGLANALNQLLDVILLDGTFDYIARMDSDDISRPQRLAKQVEFLEGNTSIDVCGTSCREFGASFALEEKHLPESHEELMNFSVTHCPLIHPSVMFRSSVFLSGIRYPVDTSLTEDMALWFILLNEGYKFSNINEILMDYRLNENTIERRTGYDKAVSEFKIRFSNMISLKKINAKNCMLIFARLIFHILPPYLMKLAYKKAR